MEIELTLDASTSERFELMCKAVGMDAEEGARYVLNNGVSSFLSLIDRFYHQH